MHYYILYIYIYIYIYIYTYLLTLDLTRSKAKVQMASGQGSHWLIESPTIIHISVTFLRCLSTLFFNIFMLLAVTQSVDQLFHSFIVLCETPGTN